jgi:hypothetical protein
MRETVYTATQILTLATTFTMMILTVSIFTEIIINLINDRRNKDNATSDNLFTVMVCVFIPNFHNDKDLRKEISYFLRPDYCIATVHKKDERKRNRKIKLKGVKRND